MSKALEVVEAKELVHQNNGKVFADSLAIAKNFEKQHGHVLRDIENLKKDLSNFGEMFSETKYLDDYNREQRMVEMTRDGFSLLAMRFTGKKALQWQLQYIKAFNTMEQIVLQNKNQEWQLTRSKGIGVRKDLSDTIKQFVDYASGQGSSKAKFYYSTITTETYKALRLLEAREKVPSSFRDTLSNFDLSALTMAEYVAQGALMEGMIQRMYYKEIYRYAKEKVLIFASSIAVAKITSQFALQHTLSKK